MPRQGRLHLPGGYYHVMGRGLERRNIFSSVEDKKDILERLGIGLEQTNCQCLAWSIMSNHYHFLIRVSTDPLSKLMGKLLSGYGTQYNRRNKRSGYVFQNRFKSILCDADTYLLELIRYIHLNPLKANLVRSLAELDRYRWTGHAGLVGKHMQSWHSIEDVLALFGTQIKHARMKYKEFISEGISSSCQKDLSGGGLIRSYGGWESIEFLRKEHEAKIGDERILGESDFVEDVLRDDQINLEQKTQFQQQGWTLEKLIDAVCCYVDIQPEKIFQKGRNNKVSMAKSLVSYWGTHIFGISSIEIARYLRISQPAVSKASQRGAEYCRQMGCQVEDILEY